MYFGEELHIVISYKIVTHKCRFIYCKAVFGLKSSSNHILCQKHLCLDISAIKFVQI